MSKLPAWAKLDNFSQKAHQAIVDAVNNSGFAPAGQLNTHNTPSGRSVVDTSLPPSIVARLFSISMNALADGCYLAKEYFPNHTIDSTSSAPITKDMLGGLPTTDDGDFYFINLGEYGETGHVLVKDTPVVGVLLAQPSLKEGRQILVGGSISDSLGEFQYMDRTMVSQNQVGYDFTRACPPLPS